MRLLKKKYNPNKPVEVREFAQEIARLTKSGPAGANQARRAIQQLSQDSEGRRLLANAAQHAHLMRQSLGSSMADVKAHTGSAAGSASSQLGAAAYSAGSQVHFGAGAGSTSSDQTLLAHELTHAVQQGAAKGHK